MKCRVLLTLFLVLVFGAMTFAASPPEVADLAPGGAPPWKPPVARTSVPEYLQDISVTVKSGRYQGSGTLVTREIGGDTVTFVWTAAHVIENLRYIREIVTADGESVYSTDFKDPTIVQERHQDGRRVGEQTLDCKVVKYSDPDYGEDLAVLMIRLKNAYPLSATVKFHADTDYIPPIGVDLSHCGSLLGQYGANSYTTGVLSQTGRLLEGKGASSKVFDQVTAVAFPGSFGGGVYLKADGTYIGMLTQGVMRLQGFNFIVPVRRMHQWAADSDIAWAIDPTVKAPTLEEIEEIAVEEAGAIPVDRGNTYSSYRESDDRGIGKWIVPNDDERSSPLSFFRKIFVEVIDEDARP